MGFAFRICAALALAAAPLGSPGAAIAGTLNADGFVSVGEGCTAQARPKIMIVEPPLFGRAYANPAKVQPQFKPDHRYYACNSAVRPGTGLFYDGLFGGYAPDQFKVLIRYNDGETVYKTSLLSGNLDEGLA